MESRNCAECKIRFSRARDLRRHMKTSKAHNRSRHICPICAKEFTRLDVLKRHQTSLCCINRFLSFVGPFYNLSIIDSTEQTNHAAKAA
ncbi:hypothetical protein BX666DRAFT_1992005 [Dichotomocladium elegans]|nr:hypothetical protein BX666DRAFT_1992005 [Dichotomocladium elegans]